jgi:hypothetical protein
MIGAMLKKKYIFCLFQRGGERKLGERKTRGKEEGGNEEKLLSSKEQSKRKNIYYQTQK